MVINIFSKVWTFFFLFLLMSVSQCPCRIVVEIWLQVYLTWLITVLWKLVEVNVWVSESPVNLWRYEFKYLLKLYLLAHSPHFYNCMMHAQVLHHSTFQLTVNACNNYQIRFMYWCHTVQATWLCYRTYLHLNFKLFISLYFLMYYFISLSLSCFLRSVLMLVCWNESFHVVYDWTPEI